MSKKYKIILGLISLLIIILIVFLITNQFNVSHKANYQVIDKIDNYDYTLDDRDSKLMREEFNKLKKVLAKDEIDYNSYASILANLFIIDLFTINNKENKYDVGSLEYVFPDIKENFKLNVTDTIYKYVNEDDKNNYPEVKKITGNTVSDTTYTYQKEDFEAYKVIVTWDYSKDLGYYTKGELILIKKDTKLYVVSFKGVEEN